jgi:hypothetical protein
LRVAAIAAMLAMPAAGAAQDVDIFGIPRPSGVMLEALIAEAQAYPLGAQENPVRAEMPQGQRAYLDRLRCANGKRPAYQRVGNFGIGVYGRIIDGYRVVCKSSEPAERMIFMDMYHPGHAEAAAVPGGFTISAP